MESGEETDLRTDEIMITQRGFRRTVPAVALIMLFIANSGCSWLNSNDANEGREDEHPSEIFFTSPHYQLGDVELSPNPLVHSIYLQSTGDTFPNISTVLTSCGCVEAVLLPKPNGDLWELALQLDRKDGGENHVQITVHTMDRRQMLTTLVTYKVVGQYRVEFSRTDFGLVGQDSMQETTVSPQFISCQRNSASVKVVIRTDVPNLELVRVESDTGIIPKCKAVRLATQFLRVSLDFNVSDSTKDISGQLFFVFENGARVTLPLELK